MIEVVKEPVRSDERHWPVGRCIRCQDHDHIAPIVGVVAIPIPQEDGAHSIEEMLFTHSLCRHCTDLLKKRVQEFVDTGD